MTFEYQGIYQMLLADRYRIRYGPTLDYLPRLRNEYADAISRTFSYDPAGPGSWRPNSTIFDRKDAVASIYFLQTDYLRYLEPVYDMWFRTDLDPIAASSTRRQMVRRSRSGPHGETFRCGCSDA